MNIDEKGIIDIQLYYPKLYVDQTELEEYDKAGKGKYTIGLGQEKMAFTGDREDINSICMTVLEKVLKRNNISPKDVGRIEVGTETFVDKSKSIKTYLMSLFKDNYDIEGVTTTNACYGGTNALFNALNWLYSDFYSGKYAIVICSDIAVYAKGRARPTGGCGAIALLLGKGACITFDKERSTYMNHVYDFYKPNPSSEYPEVDGIFSLECYFKALQKCYESLLQKDRTSVLESYDYFCFHSPFSKMVEKAFYQLVSFDLINNKEKALRNGKIYVDQNNPLFEYFCKREGTAKIDEKCIAEVKKIVGNAFKQRVEPGLFLGKNLGNIYTGSLYIGLLSLILNPKIDLRGKRVFMFSYGSGCAASIFSLRFSSNYGKLLSTNADTISSLDKRIKTSPPDYEKILIRKEQLFLKPNYKPQDGLDTLFEDTYYIEKIDEKWRRYFRKFSSKDDRKIEFNKLSNKTSLKRIELIRNQLICKTK
jgi:hydroxymethylglutaryl-CoA synthase